VDTLVPITVTPDLGTSGQSVALIVAGQDPTAGFVKINGQDRYLVTSSAVLDLRGSSQTEPGFAGQLGLLVQARDQDTVRSEGFSVAAIPVGAAVIFDSKITDPRFGGVVVALHWTSDSGDPSDLDQIGVQEQVQITEPATGSLQEIDLPNHSYIDDIAPPRLIVDYHATPVRDIRPSPGNRGDRVVVSQVFLFQDYRTGIDVTKNIPVASSGFYITREVFRDTDHRWKLRTTVEGHDAKANGFSSSAGAGLVVDLSTRVAAETPRKLSLGPMSNETGSSSTVIRSPFSGLFITPISTMSGDGGSYDFWVHDNALGFLTSEVSTVFSARKK
jgi:hypothetical protein